MISNPLNIPFKHYCSFLSSYINGINICICNEYFFSRRFLQFNIFFYLSISKLGRYLEFIFLYLYIKSKSILPIHFIEMNGGDNCSVGHWDVSPEEFRLL